MRKFKVAFWLLTIVFLVYCYIGLRYHYLIDYNTYEAVGTVLAVLYIIPASVTILDALAS